VNFGIGRFVFAFAFTCSFSVITRTSFG